MKTIEFEQPSAAADCATLFVALELSKSKWLVGIHLPGSNKLSERSVSGGNPRLRGDKPWRAACLDR